MSQETNRPPEGNAGYHSASDARRMQEMVQALLHGRRAIALSCPDTRTLEHYSRLLVRDLRQAPGVKIIAHQPGNTERLLQQVNELVADVSIDRVVERDAAASRPVHVFVVHDTPQLGTAELMVLVRLVNDLPGANLRIALIQDRDLSVTGHLKALGPQALHWEVLAKGAKPTAAGERSRDALNESLKDALREAPDTLPDWARPPQESPRRRWRLAFWRRRHAQPAAAAAPARHAAPAAKAPAQPPVKKAAARTPPKAAPKAASKASPKATTVTPRSAAKAGRPETTQSRSNRVVLVGGVFLSACLAGALGMWLQMHQPAPRAAKSAPAPAAAPATSTAPASPALSASPRSAAPHAAATVAAFAPR